MKTHLKYLILPVMVLALAFFAGCDDDPEPAADTGVDVVEDVVEDAVEDAVEEVEDDAVADVVDEFEPPTMTTVAVSFAVDDSANMVYDAAAGLAWKGSFAYDSGTNVLGYDSTWGGPYPMLRDDGDGGDATADDGIWSIGVDVEVPAAAIDQETCENPAFGWFWNTDDSQCERTFEYGLVRGSTAGSDGEWIWEGDNGSFTVIAGDTTAIEAAGLTFAEFGIIDFRLEFNTADCTTSTTDCELHEDFTPWDSSWGVGVKGSAWGWSVVELTDDGEGVFPFVLSEQIGDYDGLLHEDDQVEFVYVVGDLTADPQVEYKGVWSGDPSLGTVALPDGVWAFSNFATATATANDDCVDAAAGCEAETIFHLDNGNTTVQIGEPDPAE